MKRSRGKPRPVGPTASSRNLSKGPPCASESSNCCPLERLTRRRHRRTPPRRRVRVSAGGCATAPRLLFKPWKNAWRRRKRRWGRPPCSSRIWEPGSQKPNSRRTSCRNGWRRWSRPSLRRKNSCKCWENPSAKPRKPWADTDHDRLVRSARPAVGERAGEAIESATPMDTSEDQFQEEILQLFAEEGLEWIKQIKVALQELESGATPDKEKKHYDIILRSLTNLMGSAATVELVALQKLTLSLVPLVQAMQAQKVAATPEHFAMIRQGIALLTAAVQVLSTASQRMIVKANLEGIMQLQAEGLQRAIAKVQGIMQAAAPSAKRTVGPKGTYVDQLVQTLLELTHARPSSLEPSRNLVE